jgi:hypothetical protein
MPYEKMPQTDFSPAVRKGLEQLAKDSRLEKRVKTPPVPNKKDTIKPEPTQGLKKMEPTNPPVPNKKDTIKLEPQESRRRPEFQPELPELPVQKKKDTMPEWAKNERENMRKDKLVDDEAKAGDKARKEGMGKIGFKNGGSASSRADGCAIKGKTRGKMY